MVKLAPSLVLACYSLLSASYSSAQSSEDSRQKSTIASLMDSGAKGIYWLAWPTATYKSWEWDDFDRVSGGYEVVVKLNGLSGFDDSSLWLKLGISFNSDGIKKVRVVDHNALLMAPFQTSGVIASLGAELAKQYAASRPETPSPSQRANPPSYNFTAAAAVCILNGTNSTVRFAFRWAGGEWQNTSTDANASSVIWWPYNSATDRTSPELRIQFDSSFAEGYKPKDYVLTRFAATLPITCQAAKQYQFMRNGLSLDLFAVP